MLTVFFLQTIFSNIAICYFYEESIENEKAFPSQIEKRNSEAAIRARDKLRKVIMMVRVVQAWKRFSTRLPTFSSIVTKLTPRPSSRHLIRTFMKPKTRNILNAVQPQLLQCLSFHTACVLDQFCMTFFLPMSSFRFT